MSAQKGARSKLADVLADIKNSRVEDEYDYNNHDIAPPPAKRRSTGVNYVALSGHIPRQTRSSNNPEPKTTSAPTPRARTYILKLFDRTVDLAQFIGEDSREDPPLYPVCRAWVHGNRAHNTQNKTFETEKQPTKPEKINGSPNAAQLESTNEALTEVYSLPPARPKSDAIKKFNLTSSSEDIDIRIPESVRNFKTPENIDEIIDKSIQTMDHNDCMQLNKQRWRKVRTDWSVARKIHESRYEESFKILNDMFEVSCPTQVQK